MQPFWPSLNQVVTFVVCSYAILAGPWRERFLGSVYLAAYLATAALAFASSWHSVSLTFLADMLCLPGFLWADHKSPRAWTRWALVCQGLSIAADIVVLVGGRAYFTACIIALGIFSYGILTALLTGTISAQVRKHRERTEDQASARN